MSDEKDLEAQNPSTLSEVVQAYEAELGAFFRDRIGDPSEAEDLLQELWYRLAGTLLKQEIRHIRGWLYRVARNLIIDRYRQQAPLWLEETLQGDDPEAIGFHDRTWLLADGASPETAFWQDQFWETMDQALEAMPDKQRQVFVLHEFEGLTLRDIADQFDEPLGTIISRKGYAVRRLRDSLTTFFEDLSDDLTDPDG